MFGSPLGSVTTVGASIGEGIKTLHFVVARFKHMPTCDSVILPWCSFAIPGLHACCGLLPDPCQVGWYCIVVPCRNFGVGHWCFACVR